MLTTLVSVACCCCDDAGVCEDVPPSPTYGVGCEEDETVCEEPFSCIEHDGGAGSVTDCTTTCETDGDCPTVCNTHCGVMESECLDGVCKYPLCK